MDQGFLRVEVNYIQLNTNQFWQRPFNQATFYNFGSDTLKVNLFPIAPGTFHEVSLNTTEVNSSKFVIDFMGSTSANLWIVSTEYKAYKGDQ